MEWIALPLPAVQHLPKATTLAGRRVLDEVEGFLQFLDLADEGEPTHKTPLGRTPARFENCLPCALALDVEQSRAERFAGVFTEPGAKGREYSPGWHAGKYRSSVKPAAFTSAVATSLAGGGVDG